MLIVLLTLALAQFVAWPLLLWLAAKVVRVRGVGIARAYAAMGLLLLLSVVNLAIAVILDPPGLILVVVVCCLIPASVWLVKAVFRTGWLRAIGCLGLALAANVALAFAIRAVAVEAFIVPTSSMEPTLLPGDRFLADKFSLRFRQPRRGEVIAFHPPYELNVTNVKRVVGVEGDRLELSGDELLVNGSPTGRHSMEGVQPVPGMQLMAFPIVVPPGKLFMLGDSPGSSLDSRHWGFADANQVIGLAAMVYMSAQPPTMGFDNPNMKGHPPKAGPIRWNRIGKMIE